MLIQYVSLQVRDRAADQAAPPLAEISPGQRAVGNVYGGFGDAVHVDQLGDLIPVTFKPRR